MDTVAGRFQQPCVGHRERLPISITSRNFSSGAVFEIASLRIVRVRSRRAVSLLLAAEGERELVK